VGNARNGHKTRRFDHYDLKLHLCYTYFNIYHKLTPSENEASRRNLDRRVRTVSSKFVRTLFELCSNFSSKKVRTFVRRTSNFFESFEKEKRFGIYSIFAKFSNFSKKKRTFPEVRAKSRPRRDGGDNMCHCSVQSQEHRHCF
jgi:hypothetical protein